MKIVVDCFKLVKGTGKSIGIYNVARSLVQELSKKQKIIVLGTEYNREDFDLPGVTFVCVKYNPLNKIVCILWELYLVTVSLNRIGADVVLFPRGFSYLKLFDCFVKAKNYVIIHDMIPFYYDEHYPGVLSKFENFYIMNRLKASAKNCNRVITVSEASKNDIVRVTGIKPDKVIVIYNGMNKMDILSEERTEEEKKDVQDGQGYISAVCSALPHKNADGVVSCYKKYYELQKESGCEILGLVIIGLSDVKKYNLPEEIEAKIKCYKYLEKDSDMHKLIKNSRFFMFLSKVEGFGFPPLEAMQLGVPVICSQVSSLPEVVGDAAILVNPDDEDAVVSKMIEMESEKLRSNLIEKGYANTKRFMWDDKAEEYLKVLKG